MRSAYIVAFAVLLASGCTSSSDGCRTTADCAESGSAGSTCVNGECVRSCALDTDCADVGADFVCEHRVCVAGCPTQACAAGQECASGRCAYFYESFEAERLGGEVSLEILGWNAAACGDGVCSPAEDCADDCAGKEHGLQNKEALVVYNRDGCSIEDEEIKCAGTPADGHYYLSIERTPTPPEGTEEFGVTCGACRCCLECRDAARRDPSSQRVYLESNAGSPRPSCGNNMVETSPVCAETDRPAGTICEQCDDGNTVGGDGCSPSCQRELADCPGVTAVANMCTADVDAACSDICNQCDACPDANAGAVGTGLSSCEVDAGSKSCSACLAYETCIGANPGRPEACEDEQLPCIACREADRLTTEVPDQPSVWRDARALCDGQSLSERCYATQVARPRSQLTEDEQAVVSPAISLAGVGGEVVLEIQYVAFNIGDTYRQVDQSQPRDQWPVANQEVEVQFCGASCQDPASWKSAAFTSGAPARFPSEIEKNNGLYFANQNRTDWRANVREIAIPVELRTAEFKFRFVPRLADGARVGIDAVTVKERR
ncbi:MAG: hypothetical protein HY791_26325 [Deltaproteobacteria bacterium]|nr:hypothetical protein [Deltaproteobacteria bacterium]